MMRVRCLGSGGRRSGCREFLPDSAGEAVIGFVVFGAGVAFITGDFQAVEAEGAEVWVFAGFAAALAAAGGDFGALPAELAAGCVVVHIT